MPCLPLLSQFLQRRDYLAKQHKNNRRCDVGHNAEPEQAALFERSTRKHLHILGSSPQWSVRTTASFRYGLDRFLVEARNLYMETIFLSHFRGSLTFSLHLAASISRS